MDYKNFSLFTAGMSFLVSAILIWMPSQHTYVLILLAVLCGAAIGSYFKTGKKGREIGGA